MGLGEWHWREREKEPRELSRRGWSIGLFIVFVTGALVYTYTKSLRWIAVVHTCPSSQFFGRLRKEDCRFKANESNLVRI